MAEISPFQGIRFNKDKVGDLSKVICPPYDIISPQEQKAYHEQSDYNIIRLEAGFEHADDTPVSNRYTRARDTLDMWLKDGVFQIDTAETYYIYEQCFTFRDTRKRRMALISFVMLEPWDKGIVLPHERTAMGVKTERLELMRACRTDISPVFGLYEDPGNRVGKLMQPKMLPSKLLAEINLGDETHKVWKANEPEFVQRVSHFISPKPIYIADGHHRYETALAYRDERRQMSPSYSDYDAFNFVMMALVSFSDPGLIMLPIHRLVKGISADVLAALPEKLAEYFDITESPLEGMEMDESRVTTIRIVGLKEGVVLNLRVRRDVSLKDLMPGHSGAYQRLDVSAVETVIMEKLLNSPFEREDVTYSADIREAVKLVKSGEYQFAVLLGQMPVSSIKSIADAGDRMPRKSTYFYPKLPTGLVLGRLDGRL